MSRLSLALSISALLAAPALADNAAEFMDALGKAATGAIVAEAYMSACEASYPQNQQSRRDALAGWGHRVDLPGYYRFLDAALGSLPDLAADLEENLVRAQAQVDDDVANDGATCTDLRSVLNVNARANGPIMRQYRSLPMPSCRRLDGGIRAAPRHPALR